jgi:hypothetical protein
MYRSGFGRRHAPSILDTDIVNEEVLAGFIDAVFVLVDDIKFDHLKGIWTWICSF